MRTSSAHANATTAEEGWDMAMATARRWTLHDLHRLPDDGNKYELVRGELFVTPAPTPGHESVIARLDTILIPFVESNGLGYVYHARSVVRFDGSEAEPDLQVRATVDGFDRWEDAPKPILVVEITSRSTRRRDYKQKRAFYIDNVGIDEYWIIDREERNIHVFESHMAERIVTGTMTWSPAGVAHPLRFETDRLFAPRNPTP